MSSNPIKMRVLIFDTNILFEKGDNGCNFSDFNFNKLFQNIINQIEERDLTDYIQIAIPKVVWTELYHQRIGLYNEKIKELDKLVKNYEYPFFEYDFKEGNYETFLNERIANYKSKLKKFSVEICDIPLPSSTRFDSIIERAFMKKPPFEGVNKKSDKGFKDALIWESILEFKSINMNLEMCLYTRDGLFNEQLANEYDNCFNEKIELLNSEESVIKLIARVEKEVNHLRTPILTNIEPYSELRSIVNDRLLRNVLSEIELVHHIGLTIYDWSSIENYSVKNIVDVSDLVSINKTSYEVIIEADLTFSNGDICEDIEVKGEEIKVEFIYDVKENVFSVNKIDVLKNEYYIENIKLEVR